jgi:hypothetical protein
MISFVPAKIKEIFEMGRDYPWPKPKVCLCCKHSKLWGHGYVESYFDGFNDALLLRRYRCPLCGCIVKLKPGGYFNRFQASIKTIRFKISYRLEKGRWPSGLSRSRQGHWLRALKRKVEAYLGKTWKLGMIEAFDHLLSQGHNPVSRSI